MNDNNFRGPDDTIMDVIFYLLGIVVGVALSIGVINLIK